MSASPESPYPHAVLQELRELLLAAASARDASFSGEGQRRRIERLRSAAADDETNAALRELCAMVEAGPQLQAEHALCKRATLWAMDTAEAAHFASDLVWLATHTPFSIFEHIEEAKHLDLEAFWDQIALATERALRHEPSSWKRGEALLAIAALSYSDHPRARAHREALARLDDDPLLARVLVEGHSGVELTCTLHKLPRPPWLTWLYGLSGVLLLSSLWRIGQKLLFGVERPAHARFTLQSLDVRQIRRVRGEELGQARTFVPRASVTSVTQEPSYARLPAVVGALSLLAGTAYGTGAVVEAGRSGAASLVLFGLLALGLGLVLDYVLTELWPRRRGHVRLLIRSSEGPVFRLDEVDAAGAERALSLWRRG